MTTEKKNCYSCAYRQNIPGNCHSRCSFDFQKAELNMPRGDEHGIRKGWYMFPANYDPVWMKEDCAAHSETAKPELKREGSSMDDLFSMLAKRL